MHVFLEFYSMTWIYLYWYIFQGTLGVYLISLVTIPSWWLVGILSLSQGYILLIMAQEHLLSHAYVGYILFGTFYHIMATVAK